jgi:hypothetical protein
LTKSNFVGDFVFLSYNFEIDDKVAYLAIKTAGTVIKVNLKKTLMSN